MAHGVIPSEAAALSKHGRHQDEPRCLLTLQALGLTRSIFTSSVSKHFFFLHIGPELKSSFKNLWFDHPFPYFFLFRTTFEPLNGTLYNIYLTQTATIRSHVPCTFSINTLYTVSHCTRNASASLFVSFPCLSPRVFVPLRLLSGQSATGRLFAGPCMLCLYKT